MTNAEIAQIFTAIAVMLEMDGGNPFRIRAYREAARVVESHVEPLRTLAATEGGLESIAGIGKDLAQKIRDLLGTGTTPLYQELTAKYPPGLVALTELPGVGPKKVKVLFEQLGVVSREDLEQAAREGRIRELKGFGAKVEQNILAALARPVESMARMLIAGAWPAAHTLLEAMRELPGVTHAELAGSFRRRRETVGDLDLVVCGGSPEKVMAAFVSRPEVAEVLGQGETKSSVRLGNGLQVDLRLVPKESFGAALLYFTGSKEHNIELRKLAIERGWSLNEYSLSEGEKVVAGKTEKEIYAALDLPWIAPELREMRGEFELARAGELPKLIEEGDVRGDLHMHTDRTDGRESLETMVRACLARGYEYCAITDHSKAIAMAGGFDEERVRQSVKEIAAVRKAVPGIHVLHGLEVDILGDGSLDLPDDTLALLDWVIISLHSRLDQPAADITARVLKAIENPMVHAMAHPSARLIGTRRPAAVDFDAVFTRAAELGVWMEINAQPDRTDLDDQHARRAREKGVKIVIDTDAHRVSELDYLRYGVFAARRAGLTAKDVMNTLPYEKFTARLRKRP